MALRYGGNFSLNDTASHLNSFRLVQGRSFVRSAVLTKIRRYSVITGHRIIYITLHFRNRASCNIQGVSGGIVNILVGGSMDYSESISTYKHVSNFQWVWRYSCLNVTHKKPYKTYEGKTNDLLIAFIGHVNDLNKFQKYV